MPQHSSSHRVCRGFTLVEILVVVTILGIIGAVVGVQLGSRGDLQVDSAARTLSANVQYAQSLAIARGTPHYLFVDSEAVTVSTLADDGSWVPVTHPVDKTDLTIAFGVTGTSGGEGVSLDSFSFDGGDVFGFDASGEPVVCASDGTGVSSAVNEINFVMSVGEWQRIVAVQPVTGETSIN